MENKVTIYTIAEELGVTPTSVSRAFNPNSKLSENKRKLILETAKKYNFQPNRMASRLSKKEITIGILIYSYYEQFYSKLIKGIEDAYLDLKDYKVKYDLRLVDSKKYPSTYCNAVLDEFVRKKYDGIIVSDLINDSNIQKLNEVYAKNNNLVFINFDSKKINRLFSSIHDIERASKTAAEFIALGLKFSARKNVLVFTDDIMSFSQMKAQNAFSKEAEKLGLNIKGIYEVEKFNKMLENNDNNAKKILSDKIDGIYISSGNSMEICKYIDENGLLGKKVIVTYDTYKELNDYIRKGVISATIFQNSYMQAKTAFKKLFSHLLGEESVPSVIYTNFDIVMKNNLDLYE